jgi:hypothetical protein
MDGQKRQQQWQWVVGVVLATVCGLVAAPSVQAITSCSSSDKTLVSVGFTSSDYISRDFLDDESGQPSWTLIARAWNKYCSYASYQMTIDVAGKKCYVGPASLSQNAIGTKNCTIQPEYTVTGRYTLTASASGNCFEWKYLICQNVP